MAVSMLTAYNHTVNAVCSKLNIFTVPSVDASSELKARGVKSGDKVLEVNDIMVTDDTVDKVK